MALHTDEYLNTMDGKHDPVKSFLVEHLRKIEKPEDRDAVVEKAKDLFDTGIGWTFANAVKTVVNDFLHGWFVPGEENTGE